MGHKHLELCHLHFLFWISGVFVRCVFGFLFVITLTFFGYWPDKLHLILGQLSVSFQMA